jgi:hypothetical protein
MDEYDLFELVESKSHHKHNGTLVAVKTKTGWKVVFGTLEHPPKIMQAIDDDLSLSDALRLALIQEPTTGVK